MSVPNSKFERHKYNRIKELRMREAKHPLSTVRIQNVRRYFNVGKADTKNDR